MQTAPQQYRQSVAETRNVAVSFVGELDSGELLTGTPTVVASPTGPTISNIARNSAQITVDDEVAAIDQAVTFTVSGVTANVNYVLTVTCATSASQTIDVRCRLRGVA